MEHIERIPKLIASHLRGDISHADQQELDAWINESEANRLFFAQLTDEKLLPGNIKQFMSYDAESGLNKTLGNMEGGGSERKSLLIWLKKYTVAACFLIVAGAGVLYAIKNGNGSKKGAETVANKPSGHDIVPGIDKAILTLADGSTIELKKSDNNKIADQNGAAINQQGSRLIYIPTQSSAIGHSTISTNTVTTPRGGQYQIVLPDGTLVWLNAASSITFPVAFTNNQRVISMTGEIYFEVSPDKKKPFQVLVNGTTVEVLGTHFNVNSYSDETLIKTTLLEGSVKVVNGKSVAMVKPGQQAQVSNNSPADGTIKVVNDADVTAAVAWKNGLIAFSQTDIKVLLRQISRWYNVDIEYKNDIKVPRFFGDIPRNVSLSEVLQIIEINSKLQFTVEGNKVMVTQP